MASGKFPRWTLLLPGPWLLRALRYALQGFVHAASSEHHIQFLLLCGAAVVALGVVYRLSRLEWALVALGMATVLVAELVNTAIEEAVNLASPGQHALAKRAKDVAAAAVFVAAAGALAVGLLVLLPHFRGRP